MKRLLWVFKETHSELDYSPLVIQSLSLLLIFLTEAESYFVVTKLLEDSRKILDEKNQVNSDELRGLRWHFTFEKEDFLKSFISFIHLLKLYFIKHLEIANLFLNLLRKKAIHSIKLKSIFKILDLIIMRSFRNGQ